MKQLIFLITFMSCYLAYANMASPVIPGTLVATPFTSKYIDILGESIFIQLNANYETAKYRVKYKIKSSAQGIQIPLLFYAMDYKGDFKVWLDGREINLKKLPDNLASIEGKMYSDFSYFFQDTSSHEKQILIEEAPATSFNVSLNDLKYFEVDIAEGEHTVEIEYEAISWVDGSDWVNEYSFRYALSPAKYWKSFNNLKISFDASGYKGNISCNLPPPSSGWLHSIAHWNFNEITDDIILIKLVPEISSSAKSLIAIGPVGLALITGLILMILHVYFIIRYRNRKPAKRFSWVMIIGSIFIPLITVISSILFYDFIDAVIGQDASGRHAYFFLIIFLYPIILPFYWLIMWLVDRLYKRQINRKASTIL